MVVVKPKQKEQYPLSPDDLLAQLDAVALEIQCQACGMAVKRDNMIKAFGLSYHKDHLVCYKCSKAFSDSKLVLVEGYAFPECIHQYQHQWLCLLQAML